MAEKTLNLHIWLGLATVLIALMQLPWSPLAIMAGVLLSIIVGWIYGWWALDSDQQLWRFLLGMLFWLAGLAILGALFIFIYKLNNLTWLITLGISLLIPYFWLWRNGNMNIPLPQLKQSRLIFNYNFLLLLLILFNFLIIFILYWQARTADLVLSLWQTLPSYIFWLFILLIGLMMAYSRRDNDSSMPWLWSLFTFLVLGAAVIIYKIGYGFDPFIHLATLKLIDLQGTISPKPFYYLGQYATQLQLHWLWHIPLVWINKYLVPLIFSLYVPASIYYTWKTNFQDSQVARWLPWIIFTFPLSAYIYTTPQGLANTLVLLLLLLAINTFINNRLPIGWLWLLAFYITAIHPLAGVPAIFFMAVLHWQVGSWRSLRQTNCHKYINYLLIILGLFALPILFLLYGFISKQQFVWEWRLTQLGTDVSAWLTTSAPLINIWDWLYSILHWWPLALLALAGWGLYYSWQQGRLALLRPYLILSAILLSNYLIFAYGLRFAWLISYEQNNYTDRLWSLFWLSLLIPILIGAYNLWKKTLARGWSTRFLLIILLILIIVANWYASYPRQDPYFENKNVNTTALDLAIVQTIDTQSSDDYIVLANQAVSAAALQTFGFAHYYLGNFYYPLPTSGELYQDYLALAYQTKDTPITLAHSAQITGVKNIYLVLNNYWTNYASLVASYKKTADSYQAVADGQAYIFYFNLANTAAQ